MTDTVQAFAPPPKAPPMFVFEVFRRINRSEEEITNTASAILHAPECEYDQGHAMTLDYDLVYDLAEAFMLTLDLAKTQERATEDANDTTPERAS